MALTFDGEPGALFAEVIRSMPSPDAWLVSDVTGAVVIARSEEGLVREAILSQREDGVFEVECLASEGVDETRLEGLVLLALFACFLSIIGSWFFGPGGLLGLVVGVVLAGTVPACVLAVGQRLLDPGRDAGAEAQLERSLRFAIAQNPRVTLLDG